ncbi:MAG TPA: type II toxin-antitoxin system HicB family antitoxin [Candidatus Binataceae bacterium]|nr:type II toxin-antitoxin system HicB family antitoxin [Candidatus Binataceae bacterium]
MRVLNFKVFLQPEEEGGYSVSCPALPGCHSQGDSLDEALANIKEAIELTLEDMRAQGEPIPDPERTIVSSVA